MRHSETLKNLWKVSVNSEALMPALNMLKDNLAEYKLAEQLTSLLDSCSQVVGKIRIRMLFQKFDENPILIKNLTEFLVAFKEHQSVILGSSETYSEDDISVYKNLILWFEYVIEKLTANESCELSYIDSILLLDEIATLLEDESQKTTSKKDCVTLCEHFLIQLKNEQQPTSNFRKAINLQVTGIFEYLKRILLDSNSSIPFLIEQIEILKKGILDLEHIFEKKYNETKQESKAESKQLAEENSQVMRKAQMSLFLNPFANIQKNLGQTFLTSMCLTSDGMLAGIGNNQFFKKEEVYIYDRNKKLEVKNFDLPYMKLISSANQLLAYGTGTLKIYTPSADETTTLKMSDIAGREDCTQILPLNRQAYPWNLIMMYNEALILLDLKKSFYKKIKHEFKRDSIDIFGLTISNKQNLFLYQKVFESGKIARVRVYSFDFKNETFTELFSFEKSCLMMSAVSNEHLAFLVPIYIPDINAPQVKLTIWSARKKEKIKELTITRSVAYHKTSDTIYLVNLPNDLFAVIYSEIIAGEQIKSFVEIYNSLGTLLSKELIPDSFGKLAAIPPIYNKESGCILLQNSRAEIYEYDCNYHCKTLLTELQGCVSHLPESLRHLICDYALFPHQNGRSTVDSKEGHSDPGPSKLTAT